MIVCIQDYAYSLTSTDWAGALNYNNGENQVRAGRTSTGGYLDFYTNNTVDQTTLASNGNFVMRLAASGSVGIGTTTPSQKLDVSGSINASTYVYAGVFYDNDNTVYYTNPSATSNLLGLTVANTITGSVSGSSASCTGNAATASLATTSDRLTSRDNRTISPSEDDASKLRFGFTSYANNDTSSYADYLHLRSYADGSGGNELTATMQLENAPKNTLNSKLIWTKK